MLDKITAVVLTYNEVPNIGRLLERVRWAAQVVVVDSQSTDGTQSLASSFRNVRVIEGDAHRRRLRYPCTPRRESWPDRRRHARSASSRPLP